MRRRQGFAAKVRKITGDCFNSVVIRDQLALYSTIPQPRLFRIISQWDHTREFFLRILYSYLGGPSNLAGSDLNNNRHVWLQGGITNTGIIRNTSSTPLRYRLYVCQLKCEDAGDIPGVFLEGSTAAPGLRFATGSANDVGNAPSAAYWGFWDQTSRGASRGFYSTTSTAMLTTSTAPTSAGSSIYEECSTNTAGPGSIDNTNTPLSFIFPEMRKKLRVRCVAKGYLAGYQTRPYKYAVSAPSELRPADYISDRCQNFSRHSYFLLMRAESVAPWIPTASNFVSAGGIAPRSNAPNPHFEVPLSLVMTRRTIIRVRASGDHLPSFNQCNRFDTVPNSGYADIGGFISSAPTVFQSLIDFPNYVVRTDRVRLGPHESVGPRVTPTAAIPFSR